jgi:hypothetical protein
MQYNDYKQFSFMRAFSERRLEICDYLLGKEPEIQISSVHDLFYTGITNGRSGVELLKKLAALHADRIPEMTGLTGRVMPKRSS